MQEITIVVLSGIILIALMQVLLAIIIWRKFSNKIEASNAKTFISVTNCVNSLESIKTKMTTQLNDIAGEVTETQRHISDHLCSERAAIKKDTEEREQIIIDLKGMISQIQSVNKTVELVDQSVLFHDDVMQDLNEEINPRTTFANQEVTRCCDSVFDTIERIKSKCKTL